MQNTVDYQNRKDMDYCKKCWWFNIAEKKCMKPKGEGYCFYTRSNV